MIYLILRFGSSSHTFPSVVFHSLFLYLCPYLKSHVLNEDDRRIVIYRFVDRTEKGGNKDNNVVNIFVTC